MNLRGCWLNKVFWRSYNHIFLLLLHRSRRCRRLLNSWQAHRVAPQILPLFKALKDNLLCDCWAFQTINLIAPPLFPVELLRIDPFHPFLKANNCFDNYQSGFCAIIALKRPLWKFSTTSAEILTQEWFLFFEHLVGFSGVVINRLKSYQLDRSFFVATGNCTSTPQTLTCVVP